MRGQFRFREWQNQSVGNVFKNTNKTVRAVVLEEIVRKLNRRLQSAAKKAIFVADRIISHPMLFLNAKT